MPDVYTVDSVDDLYTTADELPSVEKTGQIQAVNPETDEATRLPYRSPIISENDHVVGDVSASDDYYHVIQFEDVMTGVADALDRYGETMDITGYIMVSDDDRKLNSYLDFETIQATPTVGDQPDRIDLGLKTRAAHTGFHGISYDIGAERQVCSNGMVAFVPEQSYSQTHSDPFDPALADQAVTGIVDSVDIVEDTVEDAATDHFNAYDEAVITLRTLGIGDESVFDDPVSAVDTALYEEQTSGDAPPTRWDAYNAATRLYSHTDDLTAEQRDRGQERAATLLTGNGTAPDATELGEHAVAQRTTELQDGAEPEFPGEAETLDALHAHYA